MTADNFLPKVVDVVADHVHDIEQAPDRLPGEDRNAESLNLDHLVRLDVAMMALHLAAARYIFRTLHAVYHQRLVKTIRGAAFFVGKSLVKAGIKSVLQIPFALATLWSEGKMTAELEKQITDSCVAAREDVRKLYLGRGKPTHKRKTKRVWTRHRSPRQRAPNKSWRSPSKR